MNTNYDMELESDLKLYCNKLIKESDVMRSIAIYWTFKWLRQTDIRILKYCQADF